MWKNAPTTTAAPVTTTTPVAYAAPETTVVDVVAPAASIEAEAEAAAEDSTALKRRVLPFRFRQSRRLAPQRSAVRPKISGRRADDLSVPQIVYGKWRPMH